MKKEIFFRTFLLVCVGLVALGFFLFSGILDFDNLTGFAIFTSGPEIGQITLNLQSPDTDNLDDAYVKGDLPNQNYGSDTDLYVKSGTPKRNAYLRFNISYIPEDKIIDNAEACLYLSDDKGEQTISVYHVYSEWEESTITWNTQPCGQDFDNSANCSLTAEDSILTNGDRTSKWLCWNVTEMLKIQYGNYNNLSFALHTPDIGDADVFYSKEHLDSSLRPYLNITYHSEIDTTYVDDDFNSGTAGWGETHFDNINDAFNVVQAGGSIYVSGGTYNEVLTLSKAVNLIGEGFETTTINGGAIGNVISVNANGVNISGLKIIGSGTNWGNSGIYLNAIGNSVIENNYLLGNRVGINFISAYSHIFRSNYVVNSTEYGIYSNNWATQNNLIYNNYFSNTDNFYAASSPPNLAFFNTTKTSGANILGGEYVGGNFWDDYSGTNQGDGFGETAYNVQGSYYDYLPLMDNSIPTIILISPQDGQAYGYNESLELNFIASDADENIDSCWYVLNSGDTVILSGCENTTINVPEGSNTLEIYINDTEGEEANDSATFQVSLGAPSILLNSPTEDYFSFHEIEFSYTPSDIDLDTCELWGNFDWEFKLNQTDSNPTSDVENIFSLILNDGDYLWNIKCNDSEGNFAFNGNKTFYIDSVSPVITLTQPAGTKTSRTEIPLVFSVEDSSPTTCFYNVYRGEAIEKSNTSVTCNSSSTFSVTIDADFVLNLYVNDSAGNINLETAEFSVDTSTTPITPPSTGGSSGGGGGGGSVSVGNVTVSSINLQIPELKLIIYKGEEKNIKISATNKGLRALNKCKVSVSENVKNVIEANDLITIGAGEIVDFMVLLKSSGLEKNTLPEIFIECVEGKKAVPLEIIFIEPNINIGLKKLSFNSAKNLLIEYEINSDEDAVTTLVYKVFDDGGNVLAEQSEEVSLKEATENREFLMEFSEEIKSNIIKVAIYSEGSEIPLIEDDLIYDSKVVGTGFLSRELLGTGSWIVLIVLVFGVIAFFIIKRILSHRNK